MKSGTLNFIRRTDLKEVKSEWANREGCDEDQILLNRMPLINRLPGDTTWSEVRIEKEDLPSLRLINEISWNDLSFSTGDIPIAARNVEIHSRVKLPLLRGVITDGLTRQQYFDRLVQSLSEFRSQAAATGHNLTLILMSCRQGGPFTILEGNHTAMALYFRHFIDEPQIQYPAHYAYLGVSFDMVNYQFFHSS